MKTIILIPARFASTRFPGKPLARLTLPSGESKSLIRLSWDAALRVKGVDEVYVVTDDERIRVAAEGFGASVLLTSPECENGTARCADALMTYGLNAELVVNLQGDAPLTPSWFVEDLVSAMKDDSKAWIATPVLQCDSVTYDHFVKDRKADRVGGTTVVFDRRKYALYFSKEVLPYVDRSTVLPANFPVYHHVGVYAYRPEALHAYSQWPIGELELHEGLEQLRFLENGVTVLCVEVDGRGQVFWELNNPEDIGRIEDVLGDLAK